MEKGRRLLILVFASILILILSTLTAFSQFTGDKPALGKLKGIILLADYGDLRLSEVRASGGMTGTDTAGRFVVNIKKFPDTVRISSAGYVPTTRIIKSLADLDREFSVKLVPVLYDLGIVDINTGYQRVKANEINGTVSVIDKKMLNERTGTNILDRILGQSSGVLLNVGRTSGNPQNNTGISIRGLGTINGPLDPLIVLDGFIYEGDINNINPFDIESVSILKDAAASSIYGARAGNGVIVLTSTKGKNNQKLIMSFNANSTIRALPDLYSYNQMASSDYVEVEQFLFGRGFFDNRINTPYLALSPAVEVLLAQRKGSITPSQANERLNALKLVDARKSYLDEFYRHALTQQYGLNLKGGGEIHNYYLSGTYDDVKGETKNTSQRLNLILNQDYRISKKLKAVTSLRLSSLSTKSGAPAYNSITSGGRLPTYLSFRNAEGNPLPVAFGYRNEYTDTAGMGKLLDWKYYPAEDYKHTTVSRQQKEIFGALALNYKILPFLSADLSYQYQYQNGATKTHADAHGYQARNLINSFSQVNRSTGAVRYVVPNGGTLSTSQDEVNSQTARLQFDLNKNIGVHSINAIAGFEGRQVATLGSGNIVYGYQPDPLTFGNVDFTTGYPNFLTGSTSLIPSSANSLTNTKYRFLSFYGNASYTFKGKYRLSGSLRRDGSNIFGANTNDKWNPLWSAGLGWSLSDENFYHIDWLPVLNLTGTFGYSGNVDLSKTASAVALYSTNTVTGLPYARVRTINNPELKWEQLAQLNIKVDFALRENRLRGTIGYFRKHGTDLYGPSEYDYTAWGGTATIVKNVADMEGYGIDAELHAVNLKGRKLGWNTDFYFNFNKNKTLKYFSQSSTAAIYNLVNSGTGITPIVGIPLYAVAAFKFAGLDASGNPQGYLNGNPSTNYAAIFAEASSSGNNIEFVGPTVPVYFGSLVNSFQYRNFSLSFNISYKLGYYTTKASISYNSLVNSGIGHGDYAFRWQKSGDELTTNIPSFIYPLNSSRDDFFTRSRENVISADQVRLDYVNLTYRLNASQWKFPFRSLDVFLNASDLGILWRANKFGLDPDYPRTWSISKGYTIGVRGSL
ncbi:SusC/RagA family TonB-linked outer membrane protein [Pedobacter aquatilis]|uniref:SusC/RagA family TonB-linked outer membrane protein n=1 Tax=Pedobacter aquatilis TaxID=351343 RepID=UPI00292F5828|nr:SusC/RagA family TonB-linked outer membrane protein [Pedobacter aquatilis]